MRNILMAVALGLACGSYAQVKNKTLGVPTKNGGDGKPTLVYELVYDSPEKLKMASLMLPLWNLSGSKINASGYDGVIGGYYWSSKYQGFLRYKIGLVDRLNTDLAGEGAFSVNKEQMSQELNMVGTYFFSSKNEEAEERIHLKTSGNVQTVTDIPATCLKSIGVNLGYAQGFTWYNFSNTTMEYAARLDESQTGTLSTGNMSTMQNYKFLKLGLTFTKAINIKGKFEGYGERTSGTLKTTWINLIYAVQNDFDDVYAYQGFDGQNTHYMVRANMTDYTPKLPFGIEFGQRFMDKHGIVSTEYGLKWVPGLTKNINFVLDVGVNFNINFLKNK